MIGDFVLIKGEETDATSAMNETQIVGQYKPMASTSSPHPAVLHELSAYLYTRVYMGSRAMFRVPIWFDMGVKARCDVYKTEGEKGGSLRDVYLHLRNEIRGRSRAGSQTLEELKPSTHAWCEHRIICGII